MTSVSSWKWKQSGIDKICKQWTACKSNAHLPLAIDVGVADTQDILERGGSHEVSLQKRAQTKRYSAVNTSILNLMQRCTFTGYQKMIRRGLYGAEVWMGHKLHRARHAAMLMPCMTTSEAYGMKLFSTR